MAPRLTNLRPKVSASRSARDASSIQETCYDENGYVHFVGRRDRMIKTLGYRRAELPRCMQPNEIAALTEIPKLPDYRHDLGTLREYAAATS